jgi:hypothetical protein
MISPFFCNCGGYKKEKVIHRRRETLEIILAYGDWI